MFTLEMDITDTSSKFFCIIVPIKLNTDDFVSQFQKTISSKLALQYLEEDKSLHTFKKKDQIYNILP